MGKARSRVSIVIPAYNEERHLEACLTAIAAQTVAPYEVIVVDNNSADRTAKIAQSFPFVRMLREQRQGVVHARNTGFDAVKGNIIGRIDADIQLPKRWVEHVQSFYALSEHENMAWTGTGYFYNVPIPQLVSWMYGFLTFRFSRLFVGHYTLWGSNMAMTTNQWRRVRTQLCDRTDIHEDLDLAIHLYDAGYNVTYDESIKTNAELRRFHTDRDTLWDYLQYWPRTLRMHKMRSWPLCWFGGVFLLYYATFILVFAEKIIVRTTGLYAILYRRFIAEH